jgi:hypothetical protein
VKRMLTAVTFALLSAALVSAQGGLTGTWEETTPSGLNAGLNLTAADAKLTGTFTVRGRTMTITDGQIAKNTFTFKAALENQPEGFTGELVGDEIKLSRDRNGKVDVITLKRAPGGTLTGKWRGQTPNGFELLLDLTATGQTLTGNLIREGESSPITEGSVTKNTFTFKAAPSGGQVEGFSGQLEGDGIKVWLDRQGPTRAASLKRVVTK